MSWPGGDCVDMLGILQGTLCIILTVSWHMYVTGILRPAPFVNKGKGNNRDFGCLRSRVSGHISS
eukprot:658690-Pyramimonas_sp.AAC.1